jgi:hypothetical protein
MSRKPNDTTEQTPDAYKEKAKTSKKKGRIKKNLTGGDEETPVTVSGGSIAISTVFDREDLDGKKHKHCKVKDVPGRKWKPVRVEIDDDNGIRTFAIAGDGGYVRVIFSRPA